MAKQFKLKVYTPSGVLFEDNISQVSFQSSDGWICLLAEHAPLIGSFELSHCYVRDLDNNKVDTIIGHGVFEFNNNVCNVFTNFFAFTKKINENAFERYEKELNITLEKQKAEYGNDVMNAITIYLKKNLNKLKELSRKK
ncbi:MAG: F0F1 ATP synthase subunit epsilon [Malacoplasma sp.]|nr:F0F1 ATP synthase subunit epsilon [Malacoplasma sp.]